MRAPPPLVPKMSIITTKTNFKMSFPPICLLGIRRVIIFELIPRMKIKEK